MRLSCDRRTKRSFRSPGVNRPRSRAEYCPASHPSHAACRQPWHPDSPCDLPSMLDNRVVAGRSRCLCCIRRYLLPPCAGEYGAEARNHSALSLGCGLSRKSRFHQVLPRSSPVISFCDRTRSQPRSRREAPPRWRNPRESNLPCEGAH